jgi:hypothetical protein
LSSIEADHVFDGFQTALLVALFRRHSQRYIDGSKSDCRRCERGVVMDIGASSRLRRKVPCFVSVALLATVSLGIRTGSAAESDPHLNRRAHPSQYSDPRCESMRGGPDLERIETRCDLREPQRKATAPSVTPSPPPRLLGGASDRQPRNADRDVGFDDAFSPQSNPGLGGTANAGANSAVNPGASADPFRRAPPGRR